MKVASKSATYRNDVPLGRGIEDLDSALIIVHQFLPNGHELPRSLVDARVLWQRLVVERLRIEVLLEC